MITRWRHLWILALGVGLMLTFGLTAHLAKQEGDRRFVLFERQLEPSLDAVTLNMRQLVAQLTAIQQLFQTLPSVDQRSFDEFSAPFLISNTAVRAFEWVPKVARADLAEFSAATTRDLGRPFQVWELESAARVAVKPRDHYFPVQFISPLETNLPALGYDLGSENDRLQTIEKTLQNKLAMATPPIKLVQARGGYGYLLFLPIYQHPHAMGSPLRGFVLAVVDPEQLIKNALAIGGQNIAAISMLDVTRYDDPLRVAYFAEKSGHSSGHLKHLRMTRKFEAAGRLFELQAVSYEHGGADYQAAAPLSTLILGCLTSLVAALLLRQFYRQQVEVSRQVELRTRDFERIQVRAQKIFEAALTSTLLVDAGGRIVDANDSACRRFGYQKVDLIGRHFETLVPSAYQEPHRQFVADYLAAPEDRLMGGGKPIFAVDRAGQTIPVSIGLSVIKEDEQLLVIVAISDLSDQYAHAQQLQAERDQSQRYIDSMYSMLVELNALGEVTLVNQYTCDILGEDKASILGKNWFEIALPPDTRLSVQAYFGDVMQKATALPEQQELPILTKEGRHLIIHWHFSYALNDAGQVQSVLGAGHDVTARRSAEKALEQLQRDQAATLSALPDLLFELSLEGRYLNYHSQRDELLYAEKAILLGNTIDEVLPAAAAAIIRQAMRDADVHGTASGYQIELEIAGQVYFFELSCARKENGGKRPATFIVLSRDITDRVQDRRELEVYRENLEGLLRVREEEISLAKSHLEAILSGSPLPTFVVDRDLKCTHWNKACDVLFAVPAAQVIGTQDVWRVFYAVRTPLLSELILRGGAMDQAGLNNAPVTPSTYVPGGFEMEAYFPKLEKWLLMTAAPIVDSQGQLMGAVETIRDVTARKQAETEAIHMRQVAESASIAKSAFLANMSHEIRTPMNAILGLTHMLLRDDLPPKQADKLERICGAADHLLNVINDILDISAIEAGKIVLERIDFELDALMRRVSTIVSHRAQQKGLELVVDIENAPTKLCGDPTRLGQALINYLGNAVKFTEHGVIVLRARRIAESETEVLLRFEVEDTGIGIAEDAINRLFGAFEQADTSMTRRFGGSGLGLSITKHIVVLMGGEVGVLSTPGVGSTFWLTAWLGKAAQSPTATAPWNGVRALVVDDVRVTQRAHAQLLRRLGVNPTVVESAAAALQVIQGAGNPAFDIGFIDWSMPDGDGLALIQQIRQSGQSFPCVLVTASGDEQIRSRALAAGFADVLLKPLGVQTLEQCLTQHFVEHSAHELTAAQFSEAPLRDVCQGKVVLLVEDDALNQMIAQDLLETAGLSVVVADNGRQAVDIFPQQHFDLVFMDMQMPVMDGVTAARHLRALPNGAEMPIIAMTANAFAEDRALCLEAGMNDFVTKPVDPEVLYRVIRHWLPPA